MIPSIIIEDDPKHSERLRKLIAKTNSPIVIKEICSDIEEAIEAIAIHKPKLLFLDISLNGNDHGGFDLLGQLKDLRIAIIFTTAHIDKNITEIRRLGLHYVVKPYVLSEIDAALSKYEERQNEKEEKQLRSLQSNLLTDNVENKVIFVNHEGGLYPITIKEVLYCFSNNTIVTFVIDATNAELRETTMRRHDVTTKKKEHQHYIEWDRHMTMKALESDLYELNFCRIHNEYLVNMMHVRKFMPGENGSGIVRLSNGESLEVSAAGKKEFMKRTGRR